jgi:hypothetical protein
MTFAHVGGLPLEETLAASGPALLTALAAAAAQLRRKLGIATRKGGGFAPCAGRRARVPSQPEPRMTDRPPTSPADAPLRAVPEPHVDCQAASGSSAPVEHVRMRCPALIATLVAMARASSGVDDQEAV